jgi:hypothetical protein
MGKAAPDPRTTNLAMTLPPVIKMFILTELVGWMKKSSPKATKNDIR